MSVEYWGIRMYGVNESQLEARHNTDPEFWGDPQILEEDYNDAREVNINLKNGKVVPLYFESTEDDSYLGFEPSYPWEIKGNARLDITKEDVEEAIVEFLKPYGYDPEDIHKAMEYINTYNCC